MILRIDEDILVVNKPAGIAVLPDGYQKEAPFLAGIIQAKYGKLWIVHRLDKHTSGVLVFARNARAHENLNTQFERRRVEKKYHALVKGCPDWEDTQVDLPLSVNGDRRHRTVADPRRGKPSLTILHVLERFTGYALIEASPRTGRTHQIRTHLASQGFPILVDPLYGDGRALYRSDFQPGSVSAGARQAPVIQRLALHAWSLKITHPTSSEALGFQAPYPVDFVEALDCLRQIAV